MKFIFFCAMTALTICFYLSTLTSCNTINIVHTVGTASDVIDEVQTPTVSTDVTVPVTPGI